MPRPIKRPSLNKFFSLLLAYFGPQGWWPTTPPNKSKPHYRPNKSLKNNSEQEKFEICLGTILTQNTNWKNVVTSISTLKKNKCLSFDSVMSLPPSKLEKWIRSSGYFRQKAKRIKIFFKSVAQQSNGSLSTFLSGPLPRIRKKLLDINGIGPETADSMMLFAQGHPVFVVDAYTRRIGERWGILNGDESYSEIQALFIGNLNSSSKIFGEFHALLVILAKEFCRSKPICHNCPVKSYCATGKKENMK